MSDAKALAKVEQLLAEGHQLKDKGDTAGALAAYEKVRA